MTGLVSFNEMGIVVLSNEAIDLVLCNKMGDIVCICVLTTLSIKVLRILVIRV